MKMSRAPQLFLSYRLGLARLSLSQRITPPHRRHEMVVLISQVDNIKSQAAPARPVPPSSTSSALQSITMRLLVLPNEHHTLLSRSPKLHLPVPAAKWVTCPKPGTQLSPSPLPSVPAATAPGSPPTSHFSSAPTWRMTFPLLLHTPSRSKPIHLRRASRIIAHSAAPPSRKSAIITALAALATCRRSHCRQDTNRPRSLRHGCSSNRSSLSSKRTSRRASMAT